MLLARVPGPVIRAAVGLSFATLAAVGTAPPALAEFTTNEIGCSGSATITSEGGKTYAVDATDSEATLPRDGSAAWTGAITTVTHNHSGAVKLKIAFWEFTIDSWGPSANSGNESARASTTEIPSWVSNVPPGKYVVSGFHRGDEGGCAGKVTANLEGSLIGSPAGIVSLAATAVAGAGLAMAARPRGRR